MGWANDLGDDAIALDSFCNGPPSQNIMVRNLNVGASTGLAVGSFTCGGMYNITFQDIKMNGSHNGVCVKSQRGRGGIS